MNAKKALLIMVSFILTLQGGVYGGRLGIKLLGVNAHVIDSAVRWGERSPRKMEATGRFVYLPGYEISWEWDTDQRFLNAGGYRAAYANYQDTMDRRSGYAHIGLRWFFPMGEGRVVSAGLGPSFFFRESWRVFPDYEPNQFLLESETFLPGYEYMLILFGDIDVRQRLSDDVSAVISVIPAIPFSILFSAGVVWEIN